MNETIPIVPQPLQQQAEGYDVVACALLMTPDMATPFASSLFSGALKIGLSRAGIQRAELVGCVAGTASLLCIFKVPEALPAVRAIHLTLREIDVLGLAHIAYFDLAEDFWRTVAPPGAGNFERYLAPDEFKVSRDKCAAAQALLKAQLALLTAQPQKAESQGQGGGGSTAT